MENADRSYLEMLEHLYANLPEKAKSKERFEVPKAEVSIEGNRTIFKNFARIAEKLRRDLPFFSKFLSRELASPVEIDGQRLIIQRRVLPDLLQQKIEKFVKLYVICKECGKPDTRIVTVEGVKMLICEACGARRVIR